MSIYVKSERTNNIYEVPGFGKLSARIIFPSGNSAFLRKEELCKTTSMSLEDYESIRIARLNKDKETLTYYSLVYSK